MSMIMSLHIQDKMNHFFVRHPGFVPQDLTGKLEKRGIRLGRKKEEHENMKTINSHYR